GTAARLYRETDKFLVGGFYLGGLSGPGSMSFADWMIALGGFIAAKIALDPRVAVGYWRGMQDQLQLRDFVSGMIMAGVFGVIVGLIACHEGLRVRGGAEGVGRATTMTVVYSIVGIIVSACLFTMIFYVFGF
ncbi:hypothetical protein LCGC14_2001100, partial [marine sediment metagenome]